jgi:hypothetical protein
LLLGSIALTLSAVYSRKNVLTGGAGMKKLLGSAAVLALAAIGVSVATAAESSAAVHALNGKGSVVETLYTDGSCTAGLGFTSVGSENLTTVGAATLVTKGCVTSLTSSTSTSTSHTITTAANGDTITSTETSTSNLNTGTSTSTSTITGGTGRFAGATGSDTGASAFAGDVFSGDPYVTRGTFTVTGTISF